MVKLRRGLSEEALKKLLEEKEKKEEEVKKLEEKKKELRELEKKLEEILENIKEEEELEMSEGKEEPSRGELPSLEEAVAGQPLQSEQALPTVEDASSVYKAKPSLELLSELYGAVRQELERGSESEVVEKAKELIYHLTQKDAYLSREAREVVEKDSSEKQYVQRLQALFDSLEQRTGVYKQ